MFPRPIPARLPGWAGGPSPQQLLDLGQPRGSAQRHGTDLRHPDGRHRRARTSHLPAGLRRARAWSHRIRGCRRMTWSRASEGPLRCSPWPSPLVEGPSSLLSVRGPAQVPDVVAAATAAPRERPDMVKLARVWCAGIWRHRVSASLAAQHSVGIRRRLVRGFPYAHCRTSTRLRHDARRINDGGLNAFCGRRGGSDRSGRCRRRRIRGGWARRVGRRGGYRTGRFCGG